MLRRLVGSDHHDQGLRREGRGLQGRATVRVHHEDAAVGDRVGEPHGDAPLTQPQVGLQDPSVQPGGEVPPVPVDVEVSQPGQVLLAGQVERALGGFRVLGAAHEVQPVRRG